MRSIIPPADEKTGFPAWLLLNGLLILSEVVAVAFLLTSFVGFFPWSEGIGLLCLLYLAFGYPLIALICWIAAEQIDREMSHPTLRKIFLAMNYLGMSISPIALLGCLLWLLL